MVLLLSLANCSGFANSKKGIENETGYDSKTKQIEVKYEEPTDLISWVEDPKNGLRQEKKIEEIKYSIQLKPAEYVLCKEYGKENFKNNDSLQNELKNISESQFYSLRVLIEGFSGEFLKYNMSITDSYEERVKYFAFNMQKDLKLIQGGDTLSCSMFHFERTYNMAPYGNFMIGFPNPKKETAEDRTFIFQDKYFGTGDIKFFFSAEKIKNSPKLSL